MKTQCYLLSRWLCAKFRDYHIVVPYLLPNFPVFCHVFSGRQVQISWRHDARSHSHTVERAIIGGDCCVAPLRTPRGGGGDSNIKKVGMLVENFEIDSEGRPIWAWLAHFMTPKKTSFKKNCCISSRATLSETLKAKNIGDFSSTP